MRTRAGLPNRIYCRAASIPNSSEDKMRLLNFQSEKYNKEGCM